MKRLSTIIIATSLLTSLCQAATLTLSNGDTLSGKVLSISDKQALTLQHISKQEPLELDTSEIIEISLCAAPPMENVPQPDQLIFTNGDYLNCKVLQQDEKVVTFSSILGESSTISLDHVASILTNLQQPRAVYTPSIHKRLLDQQQGFHLKDNNICASKYAKMIEELNLPKDFIIKYRYTWTDSPSAGFRIYICLPSEQIHAKSNGVELLMTNNSLKMNRYNKNKFNEIYDKKHNLLKEKRLAIDVQINVSRTNKAITLYIDGKQVCHSIDSKDLPPLTDNYIGVVNSSHRQVLTKFEDFGIYTWDSHFPTAPNAKPILADTNDRSLRTLKPAKPWSYHQPTQTQVSHHSRLTLTGITMDDTISKASHYAIGNCSIPRSALSTVPILTSQK